MKSIKKRIAQSMLCTVFISESVCTVMFAVIISSAAGTQESLGKKYIDPAAEISSAVLTEQNTKTAVQFADCCAEIVRLKTNTVISSLEAVSDEIKKFYSYPRDLAPKKVKRPSECAPNEYSLYFTTPDNKVVSFDMMKEIHRLGNIESFIKSTVNIQPNIISISYTSNSGVSISYNNDPSDKSDLFDGRKTEWYKKIKETESLYISDPYVDLYGRGISVTAGLPCYNINGDFIGAVCADFLFAEIRRFIYKLNTYGNFNALLVSENKILASKDLTYYNPTDFEMYFGENGSLLMKEFSDKQNGVLKTEIERKSTVCVYSLVGISDWKFVLLISEASITEPIEAMKKELDDAAHSFSHTVKMMTFHSAVLWFFTLSAVLFTAYFTAHRLSDRISENIIFLSDEIDKIGVGNLEYTSEMHTGDELELLSDSIENMTKKLRSFIGNCGKTILEKEQTEIKLHTAENILRSFLPCTFPLFPDRNEFDIYAVTDPAKEYGGNFCDFFLIGEHKLGIVVGDVSDKGIPALMLMMTARYIIKNLALDNRKPEDIFTETNLLLGENNESIMYVTAFMGIIDLETGIMEFCNAGHNPPLIGNKNKRFGKLRGKRDCVLAAFTDIKYKSHTVRLESGDILFLYTDGILNLYDTNGKIHGEEKLCGVLDSIAINEKTAPKEIADAVRRELPASFAENEMNDDITMLIIKIN